MKNSKILLILLTIFFIGINAADNTADTVYQDGILEERVTLPQSTVPLTEKPKTVITFGTFDLFHIGHKRILERARALAGENGKLVVGISSDVFSVLKKDKRPYYNQFERMGIVESLNPSYGLESS